MSDTRRLAEALIARPSVTPDDAGCQQLIAAELDGAGWRLRHLPFGDVANLWATHGSGAPLLVLAGHTDVVPPGPRSAWRSDPFRPTVRDGLLYGRGAADMKASLAAMVVAARTFVARRPGHRGTLALLVTSDEEGAAVDGTARVVEQLLLEGVHIDYCLIGEPSCEQRLGDTIKNGRRGSLSGRLTVYGVQGHIAYPDKARNPVHEALPALAELTATQWDPGNAHYPPTSFQISNINAGVGAENVIPGELTVAFNFRYSTQWTAAALEARTRELLDRHGLQYDLTWHLSGEPFLTPGGRLVEAVTAAVTEATGVRPRCSTAGGTSDGRFIAPTGAEVVEFGPVNASIHQTNEHIALADLEPLHAAYLGVIERILG